VIHVTADHVAAVYECLRRFDPWRPLKLPHAEQVEFRTTGRRDVLGEYTHWLTDGTPIIVISYANVSHLDTLAWVTGHEMIHLYQHQAKTATRSQHNIEVQRIAKRACQAMGWDYHLFA